ncbi:MAG: hypothetical protein ACJ8FK_14160 [Xanthobacteraceae bacterium]
MNRRRPPRQPTWLKLQVGQPSEIEPPLGDEGAAAPPRRAERVAAAGQAAQVAGEARSIAQVGVVEAQVEREDLGESFSKCRFFWRKTPLQKWL